MKACGSTVLAWDPGLGKVTDLHDTGAVIDAIPFKTGSIRNIPD
jgi:hypothetical protein